MSAGRRRAALMLLTFYSLLTLFLQIPPLRRVGFVAGRLLNLPPFPLRSVRRNNRQSGWEVGLGVGGGFEN